MSPRKKTSEALIFSARLNPRTSDRERMAVEIIHDLEAKGFNFKQIAVDAILKAGGATPEMFERENTPQKLLAHLETILADFSTDLMRNLKSRGEIEMDDSDGEVSQFTSNFAKGFLARQQQVMGDDEE